MTKKERIAQLAKEGHTFTEIGEIVGVSRQYASQIITKYGINVKDFRRLHEKQCIYPNFRNWWNENRMTYKVFFEAMGIIYHEKNIEMFQRYMRGASNPRKHYIDKLIAATGLPYETLFYKEELEKKE